MKFDFKKASAIYVRSLRKRPAECSTYHLRYDFTAYWSNLLALGFDPDCLCFLRFRNFPYAFKEYRSKAAGIICFFETEKQHKKLV